MISTFIDTSFVIALVNEKDEDHALALDLSVQYEGLRLLTTDGVLLEIGNSLARSFRDQASATIENFLASDEIEIVKMDQTLFDLAFEMYRAHSDKTWGLVDCVSFVVMRQNGISDALTNDGHFNQAGFRALMRHE